MTNLISVITTAVVSIYSLSISSIDGKAISLNQFKGKKILIVNTATKSHYSDQIGHMETLYQKYNGNLVIIAVPTNDFQHETGTNAEVAQQMIANFHPSFIISGLSAVRGDGQSVLYRWLSSADQNGQLDNPVPGDFTKYLINENGNLVAVFGGSVDPMDNVIQNALNN